MHLLRWIGYAHYQTADINSLRLNGALTKEDARYLIAGYEYLMRVRIVLHFNANKPQDLLSRDEQLRIAEEYEISGDKGQRPVERTAADRL